MYGGFYGVCGSGFPSPPAWGQALRGNDKNGEKFQKSYIWIPACAGMTAVAWLRAGRLCAGMTAFAWLRGDRLCEGMAGCMAAFIAFVVLDSHPHLRGDRLCEGMTVGENGILRKLEILGRPTAD